MSQQFQAPERATIESGERNSVLLASKGGAPLRRGPRGLVTWAARRVAAPEIRVWAGPLFRVTGIMGVLGCVAFLGKQGEEESTYGARVTMPAPRAEQEVAPEPLKHQEAPAPENVLAQTEPPPCSEKKESSGPSGVLSDGRIIMNEATQSDFTQLPGVGESRAEKIVELRTRMGKFRKVTDLLRVRGIGWKTLQAMKEKLVVDRPPEESAAPAEEGKESVTPGTKPAPS